MTTQSPVRRYAVVQSKAQVEDEVVSAFIMHRNAELDLAAEAGVLHVSFRINATEHEGGESRYMGILGEPVDNATGINVLIQRNGEVIALLSN